MFGKECIYEKTVTTSKESIARIYSENIIFAKAGFDIGQKFSYYLDFKNKKVTIVRLRSDKKLKYKGTMTRRKKKQYVPVLNIQRKDIEKVFAGITECKIKIYKNAIVVQPLEDENNNKQSFVNIEDCTEDNLIDCNEYINKELVNREDIEFAKPLYRIAKDDFYKYCDEHGFIEEDLGDVFEFEDDPFTNKVKEHPQVKKDIPILKKTMKVLSLFSGIGAFEKALSDNDIDYELVNYCEIDENASRAYSSIHNIPESKNLWDVTKIKVKEIASKCIDLFTHGSPCPDFSSAGLQKGGDEGSGTRSSLLWNSVEIIKEIKPKIVIWENVKNALSIRHNHNVNKYMDILRSIGYTSYCEALNSKEQGMPQSRSRVFIVSILGEHKPFKFPKKIPLKVSLQEFLTDNDKPAGVDPEIKPGCYKEFVKHYDKILESKSAIYDCKAKSDFQDKKVGIKYCPCLRASSKHAHVLDRNNAVRRITLKESFNLMGFGEKVYNTLKEIGMSATQMQKQIGNSIDVNVIRRIYDNLFNCCYIEKVG